MVSPVSLGLWLLFAWAAQDQGVSPPTPPAPPDAEILWHEAKALIPTRVILPPEFDAKRAYMLIVALHGFGSSAEAFQRVAAELAAKGFVVAVPESPYPMLVEEKLGFDWTLYHQGDDALSKRATLLAVLDQIPAVVTDLRQRYRIDGVHALGFSQGAILALATGIYNNGLFDGVVSFGLPGFDTAWFSGNTLAAGSGVRTLLVHGQEDKRAPFEESKRARDSLKGAGYDVTLRPFVGGHTVPNDQLGYAAQWMRDLKR